MKFQKIFFKNIRYIFLFFLIIIPTIIFSANIANNIKEDLLPNEQGKIIWPRASNNIDVVQSGICLNNNSGKKYFIPNKTYAEIQAFLNRHPDDITPITCCGDNNCNAIGGENPDSCPEDCQSTYCGMSVTDTRTSSYPMTSYPTYNAYNDHSPINVYPTIGIDGQCWMTKI